QTISGVIMGTPSYMAPEQARGQSKEIGPHTDVYALGAILYELLTGRPPFRGPTTLEILDQVRFQQPIPPGPLQSTVPAALEAICLKCLHKDPKQRYASADALAEDLRRFLTGERVDTGAFHPGEWLMDWVVWLGTPSVQTGPTEVWRKLKETSPRPTLAAVLWVGWLVCLGFLVGLAGQTSPEPPR